MTATTTEVDGGFGGQAKERAAAADFLVALSLIYRLELGALADVYFSFLRSTSIRCIFMFIEATWALGINGFNAVYAATMSATTTTAFVGAGFGGQAFAKVASAASSSLLSGGFQASTAARMGQPSASTDVTSD